MRYVCNMLHFFKECKYDMPISCGIDGLLITQQIGGIHPMLFQCWASVEDGGPALKQHRMNASCLLGRASRPHTFLLLSGYAFLEIDIFVLQ